MMLPTGIKFQQVSFNRSYYVNFSFELELEIVSQLYNNICCPKNSITKTTIQSKVNAFIDDRHQM